MYSWKQQWLVTPCFIFSGLTKTFFLVHKLRTSHVILVNELTTPSQQLEITVGVYLQYPHPFPCYRYYIRKKLCTWRYHNCFTKSVSFETYKRTMNNFKLRTKLEKAFTNQCSLKIDCSRSSTVEVCNGSLLNLHFGIDVLL